MMTKPVVLRCPLQRFAG